MLRVVLAALLVSCGASMLHPRTSPAKPVAPKLPAVEAALDLRGGGIVPADTYVKAWAAVFGLYALQFLVVPQNMVTDHFDAEPTPMLKFWLRGQSVSLGGLCYAVTQLPVDLAVKIALASSVLIGILYPFNAKFGYMTGEGFPTVKCTPLSTPKRLRWLPRLTYACGSRQIRCTTSRRHSCSASSSLVPSRSKHIWILSARTGAVPARLQTSASPSAAAPVNVRCRYYPRTRVAPRLFERNCALRLNHFFLSLPFRCNFKAQRGFAPG